MAKKESSTKKPGRPKWVPKELPGVTDRELAMVQSIASQGAIEKSLATLMRKKDSYVTVLFTNDGNYTVATVFVLPAKGEAIAFQGVAKYNPKDVKLGLPWSIEHGRRLSLKRAVLADEHKAATRSGHGGR